MIENGKAKHEEHGRNYAFFFFFFFFLHCQRELASQTF